jgi:alkylation response protein AidB-like acyl-CoA dehydrogenase|tara:strand:- start:739 stop:1989 length:1251 start_codon:yes stop_codon:yes gene_type:complete
MTADTHSQMINKASAVTIEVPEHREFRAEVAAWLEHNRPADPGFLLPQTFMEVGSERVLDFLRQWQYKVWSSGYLGMAWPEKYGGRGMAPVYQSIADQEMKRLRVPICFNVIGLGWAGPLIMDIGSDYEKDKHLKGILNADDIWCQGFSEPNHGSDLGSIQTKAERDGSDYVLNGSKIWTTMGNYAKYMILLARTDAQVERRYNGLSFFLAPMHTDGITTQPIKKLTGEYGFTETFFTDARIPADCIMGEEGQGWRIAMKTLQYERGAEAGAAGGISILSIVMNDLLKMAQDVEREGQPLMKDPVTRDNLVKFLIEEKALYLAENRIAIPALCADYPNSLSLSGKLRSTEFFRRMRQYALTLQGAQGSLYVGDDDSVDGGFWQRAYMNNFSTTIGGGTSQVQANIVGEHVLGLPKD